MSASPKRIAIINYGMGNVDSVGNALALLGGEFFVTNAPAELDLADAIILPGVGAFGAAMENLRRLELVDALEKQVVVRKKPYLGICLGMQLLADDSTEQGFWKGFGWLGGHVVELPHSPDVRLPHVGWNTVEPTRQRSPLLEAVDPESHFFYDHTFHYECPSEHVTAKSSYGTEFVASVQKGNIHAVQFHPEKSQRNGLKLLRRYLNLVAES